MRLITRPIVPARKSAFAAQAQANEDVLVDREHDSGMVSVVKIVVNDGLVEETCRVHAAYPGLACNRAWKLVNDKPGRRMGRRNKLVVVFTTEVV